MLNRLDNVKMTGYPAFRLGLNREYLMSLKSDNLLLPFYLEAGLKRYTYLPDDLHGGWDSPLSEIRGTVCGHWLSAAAMTYAQTGDMELKAKADFIVSEIERCQLENDGVWCFPIPEKYLLWLKRGKRTWAPTYVLHKTLMGLYDMYVSCHNETAMHIIKRVIPWFVHFTDDITPEQMKQMMWEETGGIMEIFADLYGATGDENCLTVMRRYERTELYEALLSGRNPLYNQHANMTIPEMHGAARAYEVTGEERYRKVVEAYWNNAVNRCGMFVTGSQTNGESWTPPMEHSSRIGESNQEHCVVYNMMRLADYLYRWTGEAKYADYWERNLVNGIYAQTYYIGNTSDCMGYSSMHPETGHLTYFLPLAAGSTKKWAGRTDDFWCCHCTLMQSNSFFYKYVYYTDGDSLYVAQPLDSYVTAEINGHTFSISQYEITEAGDVARLDECNSRVPSRPMYVKRAVEIKGEGRLKVRIRIPWWCAGDVNVEVNGEPVQTKTEDSYIVLDRKWKDDRIIVTIPMAVTVWPLFGRKGTPTYAYMCGPYALAGICDREKTLHYHETPSDILVPYDDRHWGSWLRGWQTIDQEENIRFVPINEIGSERYTVYFPMKKDN